jgi:DNA-directed RNA polymerase specialized sigma24 family protein
MRQLFICIFWDTCSEMNTACLSLAASAPAYEGARSPRTYLATTIADRYVGRFRIKTRPPVVHVKPQGYVRSRDVADTQTEKPKQAGQGFRGMRRRVTSLSKLLQQRRKEHGKRLAS